MRKTLDAQSEQILVKAAEAVGIYGGYDPKTNVLWYKNPFGDEAIFNPLDNDGDAFLLGVKLGIFQNAFLVPRAGHIMQKNIRDGARTDWCATYRRAITELAAESQILRG